MSAVTYLLLQNAGLSGVSLAQGAPLLINIFGSPILGTFADRYSPRKVLVASMTAAMFIALAFFAWFDVYWYTLMMLGNVIVMTTFENGYVRALPSVVGDELLDRASGIISVITNITKIVSYAAGPFLAYYLGTKFFALTAILQAISAILFARLLDAPHGSVGAEAHPKPLSMISKLREGMAYLFTHAELSMILAFSAIMNVAWGIDQVVAMKVAEDYLAVPSQWTGSYLSVSSMGGVCGALLLSLGAITSTGRSARKIAIAALLFALMVAGLLVTASPGVGFALKFFAGSVSAVIGLLTQAAVVLRAQPHLRGCLQALNITLSTTMMLAGKSVVGILSQHRSAYHIYTTMGLGVAIATLVVLGFSVVVRSRRARLPVSEPRPGG